MQRRIVETSKYKLLMINFDDKTEQNKQDHNRRWLQIYMRFRILQEKKLIKKNLFTKYLSEEVKNEKRIMEHTTAIDLLPNK